MNMDHFYGALGATFFWLLLLGPWIGAQIGRDR